ncbi:MAG TPA: BlaI/MecI/CopY family transcriptional regulator [Gemmatales bacterium]|nr:BlaI/MecI/CopY family transcriptional regulator [Gemmatales bacterium]HMP60909.1 BlaI/MecI/CopY family transcriptional regulator [Gemmatales bacterium]
MVDVAPTPREMEILKVLWDIGPAGVREVYRRLAAQQEEDLAYNTVQTLLRIMEDKGLVSHEQVGRAYIYTPLYTREASVHGFLDRVFDGAADQLVLSLLKSERLSAKELEQLQQHLDAARRRKGSRS